MVLIYQPQVNSWTGNVLNFRAAVALKPSGSQMETFGVIVGTARTEVDRGARLVNLDDFALAEIKFPTLPDNGQSYLPDLNAALPGDHLAQPAGQGSFPAPICSKMRDGHGCRVRARVAAGRCSRARPAFPARS